MEIGTWSNEMAENIDMNDSMSEEDWGILPPNVKMCSRDKSRFIQRRRNPSIKYLKLITIFSSRSVWFADILGCRWFEQSGCQQLLFRFG